MAIDISSTVELSYFLENEPWPCHVDIRTEYNGPYFDTDISNFGPGGVTTDCWKLREVKALGFEHVYDNAFPMKRDLLDYEGIVKNGYSLILEYVKYFWG